MKKVLVLVLCLSVSSMVSAQTLVSHWALDGDATNEVNAALDGAPIGGVTYGTGVFGGSAVFNGVDSGIDVNNAVITTPTTAYSLSYWVKPYTYDAGSGFDSVISTWGWQGGDTVHSVLRPAGEVAVGTWFDGPASQFQTLSVLPLNQWTHVGFTYQVTDLMAGNGVCTLYFNGVEDNVLTLTGTAAETTIRDLTIGCWDAWGTLARFMSGEVDEIKIFDGALSAEQMAELAVPEPMTLSLLALGGLALARRRR